MTEQSSIRWGIVSTANIARAQFLPALRAAGGVAEVVGSRDREKAVAWAAQHGVARGVAGYDAVVSDPNVDAVYVALVNDQHAEWTVAALRAGKTVLCEKPLCISVEQTESVLQVARETGSLLWEAFVFPFTRQMTRVEELVRGGAVGELREIQSSFYFELRNRHNIRLSPDRYGGAVNDVGCYPVRLAELLFESEARDVVTMTTWAPEGVDAETQGVVGYSGERRLSFGCGLFRPRDTFTRLLGTEGELRLTNPFHPGQLDTLELVRPESVTTEHPTGTEPPFTHALSHIHAVLRGEETPRHLAVDDSLATARALALLHQNMGR